MYSEPPRGAAPRSGRWLPNVAATLPKSAMPCGSGVCVTKTIGFGSVCAAAGGSTGPHASAMATAPVHLRRFDFIPAFPFFVFTLGSVHVPDTRLARVRQPHPRRAHRSRPDDLPRLI